MKNFRSFLSGMTPRGFTSKKAFFFFSCLAGVFMIWISKDFGINWDEWEESNYGFLILRHFFTGAKDLEYLSTINLGEPVYMITGVLSGLLNGSLHDFIQHGLSTPAHLLNFYLIAHGVDAFFGFLAILFAGLLAKELGNWKTALLTLVFLFLSPRFFGNSMNNHKDIPFAAMYVFSFYFMLRWIKALPFPPKRLSLCLIFGISAVIMTRAGGLILIPYLFLFSFGYGFVLRKNSPPPLSWLRIFLLTLTVAFLGYWGGLLLWPYAQMAPFTNPFKALLDFSNFSGSNGLVLFEGQLVYSTQLPWYYLAKWILISSPLFFISGFCMFFIFARQIFRKDRAFFACMVSFGVLFPLIFIAAKRSIVYDSWRHVLFVYPLLTIFVALAWQEAWAWADRSWGRILLGFFFAVQLAEPALWMVRNHPNEYVYFSPLVGGLKGAFTKYESDYWGNSLRKGAEWLADYHLQNAPNRPLKVRSDGSVMSSYPFLQEKLVGLYQPSTYTQDFRKSGSLFFIQYPPLCVYRLLPSTPWDYALVLPRSKPTLELETQWPPAGTIHEVKADGVTLCAVVKNPLKK
ncbi:MAG: hypothetical protein WCJ71_04490 [Candidatus Omnitrophota bacterium]